MSEKLKPNFTPVPSEKVYVDVPTISFDEFSFAIKIMNAAASLEMVTENPESRPPFTYYDEDTGEEMVIALRDHPFNRALSALHEHFDSDKSLAIGLRWFALLHLTWRQRDKNLKEWINPIEGVVEIEDALIRAAAQARLKWGRNFKLREIACLAREGGRQ